MNYKGVSIETGEWVEGWYFEAYGHSYIMKLLPEFEYDNDPIIQKLMESNYVEVHPQSIAQATGVNDKNDKPIYSSILIDGKMSDGGDKITGDNRCAVSYRSDFLRIEGCVLWDKESLSWHVAGTYTARKESCYHYLANIEELEITGSQYAKETNNG